MSEYVSYNRLPVQGLIVNERENHKTRWWVEHEVQLHVAIEGESNLYTTPATKDLVLQMLDENPQIRVLHMDFSKADYMDSTTTGVLVAQLRRLKARRPAAVMYLTIDDDRFLKRFEDAGLDKVFDIRRSGEEFDWQAELAAAEERLQQG
jgi:anti-anti-sigma factor